MAQPTASVQMKKLSETVGIPLFEQVGKRLYLTDAGRRVYEGCVQVFDALAALEAALGPLRTAEAGALRVAVSTTGMSFAPRLVGAFGAAHPGIATTIEARNRQGLLAGLARNEHDVFLFGEAPEVANVVSQQLVANPSVVLARDDHPLVHAHDIAFERLAEEPLLLREEGSGTRRAALRHFHERGLAPRVRMELGSNEAIREAILAGLGIAILPRHTFGLDPESPRYRCLDVQGFPVENHWYLAYPQGKKLSPAARAFLDFARGEVDALVQTSLRTGRAPARP
jgi:DNA-binding transcriptional LysR family regulator